MLQKTQGIVLGYIRYRETSVIANVFTEAWGLQGYLVQGVRTKKPRYSIALFQPLMLLDMVVYHKKQGGLQRVAEIRCHRPNSHILGNLKKAAIAVFLAEFLSKVVREEECNKGLFDFLRQSVITLDEEATHYELFYLRFLLQLGHYLGFGIDKAEDIYVQLRRSGQYRMMPQEVIAGIDSLIQGYVPMDRGLRRQVTDVLIRFYQLHIDSLDTLKSLKVLQEIG